MQSNSVFISEVRILEGAPAKPHGSHLPLLPFSSSSSSLSEAKKGTAAKSSSSARTRPRSTRPWILQSIPELRHCFIAISTNLWYWTQKQWAAGCVGPSTRGAVSVGRMPGTRIEPCAAIRALSASQACLWAHDAQDTGSPVCLEKWNTREHYGMTANLSVWKFLEPRCIKEEVKCLIVHSAFIIVKT